jgi:aspartate/methionine/tyrosine aminotransferase
MQISHRAAKLTTADPPPQEDGHPIMAPAAIAAVSDALARGETHYTDRPGILPLRKKVGELMQRRYGLPSEAGQITLTCGVTEARFVAIQQLLDRSGLVGAPLHAERIEGAVTLRDGRTTRTDLSSIDILYATASASPDDIQASLAAIPAHALVIFEVDGGGGFHPSHVAGFENRVITIGALGLEHGLVGARLGYLVAPPQKAPGLRDFKQALTICSTNLSQWAALAVVEDL